MIKYGILSCFLAVSFTANAKSNIVYGQDNRKDIININNSLIKKLTKSVAGRVSNFTLKSQDGIVSLLNVRKLSDFMGARVCADEKFASQPAAVDCTGFLVGPDLLVTAGHCATAYGTTVENEVTRECDAHSWIFGYKVKSNGKVNTRNIDSKNHYGCKRVIKAVFEDLNDYALIQLDRVVEGREPLKLNLKKSIRPKQSIFVVGHPSGLPMKVAQGAKVFSQEGQYFSSNLDSFGGNSGSPVFNTRTKKVEGILVRGDVDYYIGEYQGEQCRRVNTCDNNRENCIENAPDIDGEHVTNINLLKDYL